MKTRLQLRLSEARLLLKPTLSTSASLSSSCCSLVYRREREREREYGYGKPLSPARLGELGPVVLWGTQQWGGGSFSKNKEAPTFETQLLHFATYPVVTFVPFNESEAKVFWPDRQALELKALKPLTSVYVPYTPC